MALGVPLQCYKTMIKATQAGRLSQVYDASFPPKAGRLPISCFTGEGWGQGLWRKAPACLLAGSWPTPYTDMHPPSPDPYHLSPARCFVPWGDVLRCFAADACSHTHTTFFQKKPICLNISCLGAPPLQKHEESRGGHMEKQAVLCFNCHLLRFTQGQVVSAKRGL